MKKLILSVAIVLGTLSVNAQTASASVNAQTASAEKAVPQTTPATTTQTTQEFKDIKIEELPEAVRTSVAKSYPGSVINTAATNDTKTEFKLNVTVNEQTGVIYTDATGTLIKKTK